MGTTGRSASRWQLPVAVAALLTCTEQELPVEPPRLGGALHESRSLLWAMGLGQLHGSSKGRALNMS